MPTWKLILEYEGTRYRGWQEQKNARTVQGELRAAFEEVFGSKLEIAGSGRTDAGVHAIGQTAHLIAVRDMPIPKMIREVNDRLPADIHVRAISRTSSRFHARHDAIERFYLYQICARRTAFGKRFVWWIKDRLDVGAMQRAVPAFRGRHDFTSFSQTDEETTSTIVEVTHCELDFGSDLILFRIGASHFLWKMVRRIVGVLVEVGRGNLRETEFAAIFDGRLPGIAEWTAPPSGLFLELVRYPNDPPVGPLLPVISFR